MTHSSVQQIASKSLQVKRKRLTPNIFQWLVIPELLLIVDYLTSFVFATDMKKLITQCLFLFSEKRNNWHATTGQKFRSTPAAAQQSDQVSLIKLPQKYHTVLVCLSSRSSIILTNLTFPLGKCECNWAASDLSQSSQRYSTAIDRRVRFQNNAVPQLRRSVFTLSEILPVCRRAKFERCTWIRKRH